jgi:membrane-associated phospholipid phosphatase
MPRRAVLALQGAAAGVALLVLTWFAAFHVGIVEHADQSIYQGFGELDTHARLHAVAQLVASLCNPNPYVYLAVIPLGVAIARRRWWVALAIFGILLGANVTTQLLKPLLAAHRASSLLGTARPPSPASWPSGHATAAMALCLCTVLAVPSRLRPAVATAGAVFAVAVSYSFLTLQWHYFTDVLGGFLVAATWTLLGVAAVFTADARRSARAGERVAPVSIREALGPPALTVAGAVLLALLVVLARPHQVVAYARVHEGFVLGVALIGAFGLALATGFMLALRR